MRKLDITRTTEIKNGDLQAVLYAQSELEGLLNLICSNDFKGFKELGGNQQLNVLTLARAQAAEMGEIFSACLARQAIRQAKSAAKVAEVQS